MNRRSFKKAVGVGLVALAVPVVAKNPDIQELIKLRGNNSCSIPDIILEHCEDSFIPQYNPYTRRYVTQVDMSYADYSNLQEQSQTLNNDSFSIFTDIDKRSGFTADAGYLMFNPMEAVLVGKDNYRATLAIDFREVQVGFGTVGWNTYAVSDSGFISEVETYSKTSFGAILSRDWVWTEIKEKV